MEASDRAGRRYGGVSGTLALAALLTATCRPVEPAPAAGPNPPPRTFAKITHGIAAGDVTSERAVIWARADRYSAMHVLVQGPGAPQHLTAWVTEARDFAGKLVANRLSPRADYRYTVWFSDDERPDAPPPDVAATGHFRTPPAADASTSVTFGWSGDLGGLNVCRDAKEGYPLFRTLDGAKLDFFVGVGDMIYADMGCAAQGLYGNAQIPEGVAEATTVRAYWEHWKYNREDAGLRRLLASTTYYAIWDDHEVVNDFGPTDAWHRYPPYTIGADLLPLGRQALFDYNPLFEDPKAPRRLHRSYRWGKHVELVVLDTRAYRDPNPAPDPPEHPKTMLGAEQRAWLERLVTHSDATWKIVISSVPLAVPTGRGTESSGHDGWANYDLDAGYERELRAIFTTFRDAGTTNLVFLTTDVHFAQGLVFRPFPETPEFVVYEMSSGPLGAMLLPTHSLDDTFHPERLFFFGPDGQPRSYDEAKRWMNWGRIAIDGAGTLTATIVDGAGADAARLELPPAKPGPR